MSSNLLHPGGGVTLEELASRISALESADNRYALRGGSAVTYDSSGRIASLTATYITAGTLDASLITVTNLSASSITSGILDATNVSVIHIDASNISTGSLSANRIDSASITGAKLVANTITASQIAAGAITTSELAAGAVTAAKITAGTITATELASNSVTAAKINVSTLSAIVADLGTVTAGIFNGSKVNIGASYTEPFNVYGTWIDTSGNMYIQGTQVNMANADLINVDRLHFVTRSNSTTAGSMWYYDAGGSNYYFRSRNGSWNGQFDQTGF